MKKITFLMLLGLLSFFAQAQVAVSENFDGGLALPAGWTGIGYFGDVAQPCDGFSQRDNLDETSTTGNLTTPNYAGISNGTDVSVSFDYKVVDWSAGVDATPPGWGELLVNYSTDDGANWQTEYVVNDDNHITSNTCATMSFTIPAASVPAGSDFKLQFVGNWSAGNFWLYIDNVSAIQEIEGFPTCSTLTIPTPGSTGVSINTDLEWTVANNVPTNYNVTVGTTSGGNDILDVDTGLSNVYNLLPTLEYSTTYYVNITPSNANGPAEGCEEFMFTTGADPNAPVDCSSGAPINIQYCYTTNDTTTWNFQSSDGSPLNVFFNAGGIEAGWDSIIIYDGADNTAPVLFDGDNGGDLAGLSVNSTGDSVYIEIDSDGSVACSTNSSCCTSPWDFDVSCLDTTALPNCNAQMTSPENGEIDVNENADITWSPASILVTGYTVNVGTTPGGSEIGSFDTAATTIDPGTLPYETTIYVSIIPYNDNGSADCSNGAGEFSFVTKADPNQIVDCGAGEIINTTYCYNSSENESVNAFYFASSDGSPLFISFNSGEVENNWDELFIVDSDGTVLNADQPYGNGGNLAGLSWTTTGSSLTVYVESDSSVSCQSSTSIDPWDFDVTCVDTSAIPNCNASLTSPVAGAIDINEDDDIFWSPATVFVTGYFVSIGTTSGGTDIADNVDVGNVLTYDPGTMPYDTTIFVTITPYNENGSAVDCIEESFTTRADPNQVVDCSTGEGINTVYCYDSNENEGVMSFNFTSSDGSPLFIIFNSGNVENNWDELYIIDSDGTTNLNADTPYGNSGNLAGLSYTSSGDSLTVYVESDGIISCQSSTSINPWDFDVFCVDTTALPNCDAAMTAPFDGETDVDEDEDIFWSQATVLVTGYYLSIGTTPGGTDVLDGMDVGNVLTYDLGTLEYATTYYVSIVPYNDNGSADADCAEYSFTTRADPNQIVDCESAQIINTVFCYENGSNFFLELFSFQSSTGFPVNIEFNAGYIESCCDFIRIEDGNGTILYEGNNGGDLTGLTVQSITDSLVLYVDADTSVSCSSTGNTPWDFDVWCQTCLPQTVDFVVDGDCDTDPDNPEFYVNVDISDLGDATSITVTDDQGNASQVVSETGVVVMGPYSANTEVVVSAANTDDGNCIVESDTLTFVCPPAPNECSIVYAGEDVTVTCSDNETELSAVYHFFGQDTNVYTINALENCPQPATSGGTPTSLDIDDRWSDVINIGFEFCFFGGVYDQILIGSNGVLSFELENADTFNGWNIDPGDTLPNNDNASLTEANIFGVAHDIDPSVCGDISYMVLGSAPYRQFVVNYNSVCHFSCNELTSSSQIILYESSNNIDINIFDKPTCATWNDGNAVVGVQNIDDTVAFTPPGRNTGVWETTDEFWRFAPGGDESFTFEWLDDNNNVIGTTETITVAPDETTTYTAAVTYSLCTGGTSTVTNSVNVTVEGGNEDASFTMTPTCDGGTAEITGDLGGTFAFNPEPEDGAMIDPETGTVTGAINGSSYIIEYTTGGNCPETSSQTLTVEDTEAPTATCNSLTVMLVDGAYMLSQDDINAIGSGSDDNCGVASMSVSQDNFSCENIGDNIIILTVVDINGNESSCEATVTVEGVIPEITITEEPLSEFCPGSVLTAMSEGAVSYMWTTNANTPSIIVDSNGTYGVTVTSESGCSSYMEYQVTSVGDGSFLSDYTIIANNRVFLHDNNMVLSGGVGVTGNNGQIKLHQNSHINGFGEAASFALQQGSTVGEQIEEAADITLPPFVYNTQSNSDSPSVTVAPGQTMTLDGTVYDLVDIRQGATVIFTQSNVYINRIKTLEETVIEFEGCTNLYLNDLFILAKYGNLNPTAQRVSLYVNNDVHVEKGCKVEALIYANGNNQILAKGANLNSPNPESTFMKGLFIANRVHGDQNVYWDAGDICEPCPVDDSNMNRIANFDVVSYPNPSKSNFNLKLRSDDFFTDASVNVYDLSGKLIHTTTLKPGQELRFGSELEGGIYLVKVKQGKNTKVVRLIKH